MVPTTPHIWYPATIEPLCTLAASIIVHQPVKNWKCYCKWLVKCIVRLITKNPAKIAAYALRFRPPSNHTHGGILKFSKQSLMPIFKEFLNKLKNKNNSHWTDVTFIFMSKSRICQKRKSAFLFSAVYPEHFTEHGVLLV